MKALLIVDEQNDFMPGGAIPVPEGDQVVAATNQLMDNYDLIVATQDWHPVDHCSFASNHPGKELGEVVKIEYKRPDLALEQVLLPDHCIQRTPGSKFPPELDRKKINAVVRKGSNPRIDAYSAFHDNGQLKSTVLSDYLKDRGVDEVHIVGLAADYGVKATALDAVKEGFKTVVFTDATRGVNINDGDVEKAFKEMEKAGVELIESSVAVS